MNDIEEVAAVYRAADPHKWMGVAKDFRSLPVAEAAARYNRATVQDALGLEAVGGVDRCIATARDVCADQTRYALVVAIRPAILLAALLNATPGWRVEPETGTVYRLYAEDGQDVTVHPHAPGRYRRAVRVDLGVYMYGVADLHLDAEQGFVCHGETDSPAEAVRLVMAEPLPKES